MIDSHQKVEGFLQRYRFRLALPYLQGDIMDFGGNEGELKPFVKGKYIVVNYDHSLMGDSIFDTIVALAVIEHINVSEVFQIFKLFRDKYIQPHGTLLLTTPTPIAKPVLEFLAILGVIQKHNIEEHKHYWSKTDIYKLAEKSGFIVEKYQKFQLGMNQFAVLKPKL